MLGQSRILRKGRKREKQNSALGTGITFGREQGVGNTYLRSIHVICPALLFRNGVVTSLQATLAVQGQPVSACHEQREGGFLIFLGSSDTVKSVDPCLITGAGNNRITIGRHTYQLFGIFLNFVFRVLLSESLLKQDRWVCFLLVNITLRDENILGERHSALAQGSELFAVRQ